MLRLMTRDAFAAGLSMCLFACADPSPSDAGSLPDGAVVADGGADASSVTLCARDADCDDDVFCNGAERCAPGAPGSDARGCAAADPPCEPTQICDEATDACTSDCGTDPDADGDGHEAAECGGTDCDDSDPGVNPGVMELCDAMGRDEDCDPSTIGPDADLDGFIRGDCCNRQLDGSLACGNDCNDMNGEINPDAIEVCNGLDDNCDGSLDPTIEDADGDGWAGCADLPVAMRDCDDDDATTYPGATELCDGVDNDCDGAAAGEDEDGDGFLATSATCAGGAWAERPRTDCDDGDRTVAPGAAEQCDAVDHDCDGDTDEAPAAASCPAVANTTFACVSEACEVDSCGMGYGDCDTTAANGCEQALSTVDYCGSCTTSCSWECGAGVCNDPVLTVAGYGHTCSLLADGRVRCWGSNENGELGLGTMGTTPALRPAGVVQQILDPIGVGDLSRVSQLTLGIYLSCAANFDGNLYCWGANDYGQLGQGLVGASRPYASRVYYYDGGIPLGDVRQVSAYGFHVCATRADSSVVCWGRNDRGQVAGSVDPQPTPATVAGLPAVIEVRVGGDFTCARTVGREVYCWGQNASGELGRGAAGAADPVPARVVAATGSGFLTGVDELAVGSGHACGRVGSEVVCWGRNGFGELGDGTQVDRARPVFVLDGVSRLSGVSSISVGGLFSCATVGGRVRCWGRNHVGQLGNGTFDSPVLTPSVVQRDSGGALTTTGSLTPSSASTCVQVGSTPYCWGWNAYGQLGNGDRITRSGASAVLAPLLP